MSDKMLCPGCDSYGSSVSARVRDGEPCPYCELDAETILRVTQVRERAADKHLRAELSEALMRAARAEQETRALRAALDRVKAAMETPWD